MTAGRAAPAGLAGDDTLRLDDARVVVTGGSLGIGLACATELVERGARVVVMARGAADLERARASLSAAGKDRVRAVRGDVTSESDVERALDVCGRELGGFTALVHAAGVLGPVGPVVDTDSAEWWRAVETNLLGTYLAARGAARRLRAAGRGGRLLLFSGGGASGPFPSYTAYASSKVAVVRFAETLAVELQPDRIMVNAIAPGFVVTRIHEGTLAAGERAGADYLRSTKEQIEQGGVPPELAARLVAFLLGPGGDGITGRLISAPWDRWWEWPAHREEIAGSDLFTLRRIVPKDRGKSWR